ncbi:hypothetical protein HON36_05355 [Candidatus Parcubacteria bacterium]|jgi:hypothetical protein|nr:hypothetical protein [Candidatus Parcubacteria bacterium]MBT7228231.1 hypothetical protein [Candidatus Parcubacteria bacterium]
MYTRNNCVGLVRDIRALKEFVPAYDGHLESFLSDQNKLNLQNLRRKKRGGVAKINNCRETLVHIVYSILLDKGESNKTIIINDVKLVYSKHDNDILDIHIPPSIQMKDSAKLTELIEDGNFKEVFPGRDVLIGILRQIAMYRKYKIKNIFHGPDNALSISIEISNT